MPFDEEILAECAPLPEEEVRLVDSHLDALKALRFGFGADIVFDDLISFLACPGIGRDQAIMLIGRKYWISLEPYIWVMSIIFDVSGFKEQDWYRYLEWLEPRDGEMAELLRTARFSSREELLISREYVDQVDRKELINAVFNRLYREFNVGSSTKGQSDGLAKAFAMLTRLEELRKSEGGSDDTSLFSEFFSKLKFKVDNTPMPHISEPQFESLREQLAAERTKGID